MYSFLANFAGWIAQKVGTIVLVALIATVACAIWLFVQDQRQSAARPNASEQVLAAERDRLLLAQAEIEKRVAEFREETVLQRQRIEQAERIIDSLRALESWWDRLWGNRDQQKANAEQLAKMERLRSDAASRSDFLESEIRRAGWEKDGLEISLQRLEREMAHLRDGEAGAIRYLERAWTTMRGYLLIGLGAWLLGPTCWSLTLFYGLAPLAERSRAIRLAENPAPIPAVGASHVSVDAILGPGQVMRVREKYLQSSDEALRRRTRFVFDWRIPFTSVACGLVELVEMRNEAREDYRATLSNAEDPHVELSILEIPAGSSFVLRPTFLAGVIHAANERLVIRRRWQLFRLQAWINGQFRFFEFEGPCRLVVAGSRGVRAERLEGPSEQPGPARRTNQDATVGFTPALHYRPVRAETFWGYYRGMNPLFDDLFYGRGMFLVQETSLEPGSAAKAGRFWSGLWNALLKVFGI